MEFEDEHDEEQEEEEDDEEDITIPPPPLPPPTYDSLGGAAALNSAPHHRPRVNPVLRSGTTRYRECLKNHAVNIGGHAVDGCGEFMAAGEEGTLDALKCAACNCHRNFHRKETDTTGAAADPTTPSSATPHPPPPPAPSSGGTMYPQFSAYYRNPGPPSGYLHVSGPPHPQHHRPLAALPSTSGGTHSGDMDDMSHPSSSGGGGGGGGGGMRESGSGSKKRYRTKFSQEQKDKMLAFAEKVGWRIQKHDETAVQQFCAEVQVKRQVLKVWMHNNKHTLGKKP